MSAAAPTLARRLTCLIYELLVVFSILLVGFLFPQAVLYGFGLFTSGQLLLAHIFFLLLFYFVWFWTHAGQTLAMKTWKLRIVDAEGGPLRPMQAVLRYMAAWPSVLLVGIGIVWALFDRDRQFLHDRIAGTRIVSEIR